MSVEIKGINNLIKKLHKLSELDAKDAVEEVAKDISNAITLACPEDSGEGKEEIGIVDKRQYSNSAFIDVGLARSKSDWNKIRGAYFNNYGWKSGGSFYAPHRGWFDNAVAQEAKKVKAKLRKKIKEKIKEFNE